MKQEHNVNIRYDLEQTKERHMTRFIEKQFYLLKEDVRVKKQFKDDSMEFDFIVNITPFELNKMMDKIYKEAQDKEFKLNSTTSTYTTKITFIGKDTQELERIQSELSSVQFKDKTVFEKTAEGMNLSFAHLSDIKPAFEKLNTLTTNVKFFNDFTEDSIIEKTNLKSNSKKLTP